MSRTQSLLLPVLVVFLGLPTWSSATTYEIDLVAGSLAYNHVFTGPEFVSEQCAFYHNVLTPPPIEYTNVIMGEFFECANPWRARLDSTGLFYQASWPEIDATSIRHAQYQVSLNSYVEVFAPTILRVTSLVLGEPTLESYHLFHVSDIDRGVFTTHELDLGEMSLNLILEPGFYELGIAVDMQGESADGVTIAPYLADIAVVLGESEPVGVTSRSWGHIKALYSQ